MYNGDSRRQREEAEAELASFVQSLNFGNENTIGSDISDSESIPDYPLHEEIHTSHRQYIHELNVRNITLTMQDFECDHPNPVLMECSICFEPKGVCISYNINCVVQPGIICGDCLTECDLIHPLTRESVIYLSPFTQSHNMVLSIYCDTNKCKVRDPELFLARMIVGHEFSRILLLEYATNGI